MALASKFDRIGKCQSDLTEVLSEYREDFSPGITFSGSLLLGNHLDLMCLKISFAFMLPGSFARDCSKFVVASDHRPSVAIASP